MKICEFLAIPKICSSVRAHGKDRWQCRCPAHEDHTPSLSITVTGDGAILLKCHAGCNVACICDALGIQMKDLFDNDDSNRRRSGVRISNTYDYHDEENQQLFQVVRMVPKDFRQRRPDGKGGWLWDLDGVRRVLYRLPELVHSDGTIFFVEGEKDADSLVELGLTATCNPGGAGQWRFEYTRFTKGRPVVIIPDNDPAGYKHAQQVANDLIRVAAEVRIVELPDLPEKGDVSDWLTAGGTKDELLELVAAAPILTADHLVPPTKAGAANDSTGSSQTPSKSGGLSQATQLVDLAHDAVLFHDGRGRAYATVPVADHHENYRLASKALRRWLVGQFWKAYGKAPNGQAVKSAMAALEAQALFEGPEVAVAVRLAEDEGAIWLDLANASWQAVKIIEDGWQIVDDPPVRFLRPMGVAALPDPVGGDRVDQLRSFLNLGSEDDWALLASWMLAALRPTGPYPLLVVSGEQGSAKSTLCRTVKGIIDPNISALRTTPREVRDLMIAAANGWVLAYDNLSSIPVWLSDALCRLATGGGFSTRELYTDGEEILFDATRPMIINAIDDIAERSDLLDRCICLHLPTIPEDARRTEQQLRANLEQNHPLILGALLDAVSVAMRHLPITRVDSPPRMADFAVWATAGEQGLGLAQGTFLQAYRANRADANSLALDACVVSPVIQAFVTDRGSWQGTAQELLDVLDQIGGFENLQKRRDWPRTPQAMGKLIRRIAPNLRRNHIDVGFERASSRGRQRLIYLQQQDDPSSDPSETSRTTAPDRPGDNRTDMSDVSDRKAQATAGASSQNSGEGKSHG